MNHSCLYHKLAKQKQRQKSCSNESRRSGKRISRYQDRSFYENKIKDSRSQQQQFNDYTIYPVKEKTKKIKLCGDQPDKGQYISNYSNNRVGSSRFYKTLGQQYYISKQKSFRSANSHHNNRQKLITSRKQKSYKHQEKNTFQAVQKDVYEEKIEILESKITELTKKMELCEAETKRNHYEFVLLRDIVQKLKIQNLEYISRINAGDDFIKHGNTFRIDEVFQQEMSQKQIIKERNVHKELGQQNQAKGGIYPQQKEEDEYKIDLSQKLSYYPYSLKR